MFDPMPLLGGFSRGQLNCVLSGYSTRLCLTGKALGKDIILVRGLLHWIVSPLPFNRISVLRFGRTSS